MLGTQQHSTACVGEQRGTNVSIRVQVGMLGGQVAAPSTGVGSGVGAGTGTGAGAGSCGVLGVQQHSTASVGEQRGTNVSVARQVDMLGGQVAAPSTGAGSGVAPAWSEKATL